MQYSRLGETGLKVSRLGVGVAEIGYILSLADDAKAGAVLNQAIDGGVTFFDTAACYGVAEEMIGRTISHRRDEYILATKAGHAVGDFKGSAWTAATIEHSIERSLKRMRTDRIDLVQLHTCDVGVLEKGDVIRALQDAKKAGKTRFIGYSGDGDRARWAIRSGVFDTIMTSFNLVDQKALADLFPEAEARNMGILAKRPLANGVWGVPDYPRPIPHLPDYGKEYFVRAQAMQKTGPLPSGPQNPVALTLGFVLAHDEVDVAVLGTLSPAHMRSNIELVERELPLPPALIDELHERFRLLGKDWEQRI